MRKSWEDRYGKKEDQILFLLLASIPYRIFTSASDSRYGKRYARTLGSRTDIRLGDFRPVCDDVRISVDVSVVYRTSLDPGSVPIYE